MKKSKKIAFLTIIFILILLYSTQVLAAFSVTDLSGTKINNSAATDLGNTIITVVSTIGSILSVIVLVIIGIKYMLGSAEEKSAYKQSLMPYFIGAICVFAASSIAGIIYNMSF